MYRGNKQNADNRFIIQDDENKLQHSVYNLYLTAKEYNMKLSTNLKKVMAFKGNEPVISKIVINNKIIEQVSEFNYLGHNITYEYEKNQ